MPPESPHQYAVLGAGLMGRVVAKDLLQVEPDARVTLVDRSPALLTDAASFIADRRLRAHQLDVTDAEPAASVLAGHAAVVNALPHRYSLAGIDAAIAAEVSIVDLVGAEPERRRALDGRAREAGILILPGCGVAPGLSNVLVARGVARLDDTDEAIIYVGGIPRTKAPPLEYQTVYSLTSVLSAYVRPARIVVDGQDRSVDPLSGVEQLEFPPPLGTLEAFYTDGLGSLRLTMKGRVRRLLAEKTIRYCGHAARMQLLKDCGLLDATPVRVGNVEVVPVELLIECLTPALRLGPEGDILVMRVVVRGVKDGAPHTHTFDLVDYFDPETGYTAMARTTGLPAAHAARKIADGTIQDIGVHFPEQVFVGALGDELLAALEACGMSMRYSESERSLP